MPRDRHDRNNVTGGGGAASGDTSTAGGGGVAIWCTIVGCAGVIRGGTPDSSKGMGHWQSSVLVIGGVTEGGAIGNRAPDLREARVVRQARPATYTGGAAIERTTGKGAGVAEGGAAWQCREVAMISNALARYSLGSR
jgi:hypothetical protein